MPRLTIRLPPYRSHRCWGRVTWQGREDSNLYFGVDVLEGRFGEPSAC